jgi:hypothetical protein
MEAWFLGWLADEMGMVRREVEGTPHIFGMTLLITELGSSLCGDPSCD